MLNTFRTHSQTNIRHNDTKEFTQEKIILLVDICKSQEVFTQCREGLAAEFWVLIGQEVSH